MCWADGKNESGFFGLLVRQPEIGFIWIKSLNISKAIRKAKQRFRTTTQDFQMLHRSAQ